MTRHWCKECRAMVDTYPKRISISYPDMPPGHVYADICMECGNATYNPGRCGYCGDPCDPDEELCDDCRVTLTAVALDTIEELCNPDAEGKTSLEDEIEALDAFQIVLDEIYNQKRNELVRRNAARLEELRKEREERDHSTADSEGQRPDHNDAYQGQGLRAGL